MKNRLIIFEDDSFANFFPLTLNRPTFFLRCGAYALWEKIAKKITYDSISFSCRDELAALTMNHSGIACNSIENTSEERLIFLNGRCQLSDELVQEIELCSENSIFTCGDFTAAIVISDSNSLSIDINSWFSGKNASDTLEIKADIVEIDLQYYSYLWDLIDNNHIEITSDYNLYFRADKTNAIKNSTLIDSSARILNTDNIFIAPDAEIGANVVIYNRHGPVIIDKKAVIGPLSYIEGPCYIGPDTQIFRGNIREGCSFGPACRVGGEVEESIFQGYTNKYHDGFMGHAYLGSWVNLGAMTTNSDLKNNYKNISVAVNGQIINTGQIKIGSFIGDYTKTGIGTLINTGVSIGFSCNIFGGTLVTLKEVPSFSWGNETGYDPYRLDKAIETARATTNRRDIPFTPEDEKIFSFIYEANR